MSNSPNSIVSNSVSLIVGNLDTKIVRYFILFSDFPSYTEDIGETTNGAA